MQLGMSALGQKRTSITFQSGVVCCTAKVRYAPQPSKAASGQLFALRAAALCCTTDRRLSMVTTMEMRLAAAASCEPSFHIFVVSAFCIEHRQQKTFASVKEP